MNFLSSFYIQLIIICACVLFIINIYKRINKNTIKFEEASLWLVKIILLIVGTIISIIFKYFFNLHLSIILSLIFILILILFIYNLDTKISKYRNEIKTLTQKQSLLEKRLRNLEEKLKVGK